jgi:hypothetical protein
MNFYSPFPMHGYHMKVAGAGIAFLGVLFFGWVFISGQPVSWLEFNFDEQIQFSLLILAFGLYTMAFSKEKVDDERVQRIRQVALRISFQLLVAIFIVFNFAALLGKFEVAYSLYLVIFALVFYHLVFHIALFRNPDWAFKDVTVAENFQMNRKFYIMYALVLVILFATIALVNYFRN